MVTLTTGIMFLLFTCMHYWMWGILQSWSMCVWLPMKWSMIAENLKTAVLEAQTHGHDYENHMAM
jgi:hypothetical protein